MDESQAQPKSETYVLEDLVRMTWKGHVHVPSFQRTFRWNRSDIINLFDSIRRGFPIGNLLLWVQPAQQGTIKLGNLIIEAPEKPDALWVVDGQQRIISLANAFHKESNAKPFDIYYDLREKKFLSTPRKIERQHIRVSTLFDLDELLLHFHDVDAELKDYFGEARKTARLLREYRVPAYKVSHNDRDVLIEIFDRMNNYGKRLKRAEIFSALYADEGQGSSKKPLDVIQAELDASTDFGLIEQDTLLQALLARRDPDFTRDARGEFEKPSKDFPGENRDDAYEATAVALRKAVGFLTEEAHVPHIALISYKILLPVLARFFSHFPSPDAWSITLLRRFFWRASIAGSSAFQGSFASFARQLSGCIVKDDEMGSIQRLLEKIGDKYEPLDITRDLVATSATLKMVLCSWWALDPRSPFTAEPYSSADLSELLEGSSTATPALVNILPEIKMGGKKVANRTFFLESDRSSDEMIQNITFKPAEISTENWRLTLESHCMSEETSAYLQWDKNSEFLNCREGLIQKQFKLFSDQMTEWERKDLPPMNMLVFSDEEELNRRERN